MSMDSSRRSRRLRHCWPAMVVVWPCLALAASGSWSGSVEGPRVAGPDRIYASAPLTAPALAAGARIRRVRWRYEVPPGHAPVAELCVDRHCVPLDSARGSSDALAGRSADAPLVFRFRLPRGERRPVQVGAIHVLVDYRPINQTVVEIGALSPHPNPGQRP